VDGGNGADTLLLSEPWHATWNITGANTGTLNNTTTFHNFENLTGSIGRDRFVFSPGATLSGFILGGGGWDTLDYSAFRTPVTVNLYNGVAHTHGVSQVEMVLGGSASDLFTGSNANEAFVGGKGADRINGGGGKDLLIGGLDADILDGGLGEDLLIAGITNFDANDAALALIMTEWTRAFTSYEERVARLEAGVNSGVTQVALARNVTVFTDNVQDTLRGGPGIEPDYFFADAGLPVMIGGTVHYFNSDLTPDWVSGEKKR
jgi:Ca2+-binding RTX toxin-like protein